VDEGHIDNANAFGHRQEDIPWSTRSGGGAIGGFAWAVGEIREAAEGGLKCGGSARPVHSTAQHPCQDVVAQHGLCSQGGAPHAVVGFRAAKGGTTDTLHVRSIGGKHGEAEAVSDAFLKLPAFELEGSAELESIQRCRGGAAGAAEATIYLRMAHTAMPHYTGMAVQRHNSGMIQNRGEVGLFPCARHTVFSE
jgi:hypothetical protein